MSPSEPGDATTDGSRRGAAALRSAPALALLVAGAVGFALLSREPDRPKLPPAPPQAVRTRVLTVQPGDFPVVVRAQGVVRARDEITLSPQVSGRISRLGDRFEDGAFFEAGEVLVELEDEDYRTAVEMAEARWHSTEAGRKLAELNQRRDQDLLKDRLLPEAQAEATEATLAQARAEVNAAAAQLDRARRDLERTRIRAPFNGCVRRRSAGPGQWVSPGTALGTIFSVDEAEVRLPVAVRDLRFIDLPDPVHRVPISGDPGYWGAGVLIPWPALPTVEVTLTDPLDPTSAIRRAGSVVRTEGALDDNSLDAVLIVRVLDPFGLDLPQPILRPGHPVAGLIRGRVLTNVIVLPRVAVRELDRVHLVHRDRLTLTSRRIHAVWSDEDHIVVPAESIPQDHLVATTQLVYAPEGAKVEIIPDTPSRGSSATNAATGTPTPRTP